MKVLFSNTWYCIAIAAALSACDTSDHSERQSLMEISKQELADAIAERDQLLALVKEISAGMQQIRQLESRTVQASADSRDVSAVRSQILGDIAEIKQITQERKRYIDRLEKSLENSTINNNELHETLDALRMQLDAQMAEVESLRLQLISATERIGDLNQSVDSLNSTVTSVTEELDAAQAEALILENKLNLCYYVVATKSQLNDADIVKGGFLRKTQVLPENFDSTAFITDDRRTLLRIPLHSRKARVYTSHPDSSYEIVEADGAKTLVILDPARFWSLSNYLVVMID
ncbi:MAG: hypothetical protein HDS51_07870 [Barnesiella sp.]|nr:hypothetical protein [Barnesiella sp.]